MKQSIVIRDCALDDAQALWRLNRDAFGYDYPPDKTALRLSQLLKDPTQRLFVAERVGQVVGYIHGGDYQCCYSDPLKNILAIAVDEAVRGEGAGRLLLAAVEDWARATGCAGVRLVSGENRQQAHGFYLHCGYTMRKLQKNFIKLF